MNASILVVLALTGMAAAIPAAISSYAVHTPVSSVSSYQSHIAHPSVIHGAPAVYASHIASPYSISHDIRAAPIISHGIGSPIVSAYGIDSGIIGSRIIDHGIGSRIIDHGIGSRIIGHGIGSRIIDHGIIGSRIIGGHGLLIK